MDSKPRKIDHTIGDLQMGKYISLMQNSPRGNGRPNSRLEGLCPHASQVWKQLHPLNCWTKFFSEDTKSWFRANLQYYDKITNRKNWAEVFATSCWFIWRWRNSQLHEDNPEMPRKPAMQIWKYINNYSQKWGGDNLQEHRGKSYMWSGLYQIRDG